MMSCSTTDRVFIRGSVEYVDVLLNSDVTLDAQMVEFSLRPDEWFPATWIGSPGNSRVARALVDFSLYYTGTYRLRARITDLPEVPIMDVAVIEVRP